MNKAILNGPMWTDAFGFSVSQRKEDVILSARQALFSCQPSGLSRKKLESLSQADNSSAQHKLGPDQT